MGIEKRGSLFGPTNVETYRLVDVTGENRSETGELIYWSPSHTVTVIYLGVAEDVLPKELSFRGPLLPRADPVNYQAYRPIFRSPDTPARKGAGPGWSRPKGAD